MHHLNKKSTKFKDKAEKGGGDLTVTKPSGNEEGCLVFTFSHIYYGMDQTGLRGVSAKTGWLRERRLNVIHKGQSDVSMTITFVQSQALYGLKLEQIYAGKNN